jgi:hypothetical protein
VKYKTIPDSFTEVCEKKDQWKPRSLKPLKVEAASTDWVPKFRLHQSNSPITLHSALQNAYLSMEESLALFAIKCVWFPASI